MPAIRVWDRRKQEIIKMLMSRPYTADELAEHFNLDRTYLRIMMGPMVKSRRIFGIGNGGHPTSYELNRNFPGV